MVAETHLKTTLAILLFSTALGICGTVQAQIIYVDTDAGGANNGSSWTDAYNYLQDALTAAVGSDEIQVAQGTYKPDQGAGITAGDRYATFQLIDGVTIKGGYAGFDETNPDARDVDLYQTILSGDLASDDGVNFANNTENSYQVVTGSGTDATAVLDGFRITAGNANGTGTYRYGSGMYNDQGSPTLTNCTVRDNWASSGGGGGIYNINSSPTLTDCSFTDNWADGMDNYDSNPTLTGCIFSGNFKAMHNDNSSPTLTNCTFTGNERGMYNEQSSPTLAGCTFTNNNGAMSNWGGSNPTLTNCTFTQNTSTGNGGGVYNDYANPVMTDCTFISNSANYGGAVYNYYSTPTLTNCAFTDNSALSHSGAIRNFNSNAVLNNCTFIANSADTDGGAIGNSQSSPTLTDCTFSANSALNHGGGIYNNAGTPILTNCTFSENTAFAGAGIDNQNANAILTDCTFIANSTDEYGAAINNRTSSPQITRCIFLGNIANDFGGGAVCNWSSSPTIRNCLFNANVSSEEGGAIMNNRSAPVLFNCTFVDNTAGVGGNAVAFYSYLNDPPSSLQASNCIFWDGGDEIWKNEETGISITYSDVQGGWIGVGNLSADPLFVDAAIDDYHLLPGSSCRNAGDPAYVPVPGETDLDGQPRVIDGRIDIGVYEHTAVVPIEVGISPGVINLKSQGKWITALLTFPEGYNVADVDTATILLQGQIQMQELAWSDEVTREVMVRFNRADVQPILNPGNVEVTITGSLTDGTAFKGSAVIKVMNKGGGKPPK
jgi:parallel beta-helix repeat protein/predicted outer membrane repeat protein